MGLDFIERYPEARAVFADAAIALAYDPAEICKGADLRINLTEFTQPCILTVEAAMLAVLRSRYGFAPRVFAGHGLGEYTALVAAGALDFGRALRLVRRRGELMQQAVPSGEGLMAALMMEKLPRAEILQAAELEGVDLGNDNSETQLVLSGLREPVEKVLERFRPLEAAGEMRILTIPVSAPFNSRHLQAIEPAFRKELEAARADFDAAKAASVLSNWTGEFHSGNAEDQIEGLVRQIGSTVRWRDIMKRLTERANGSILEVGPERALRSLFYSQGQQITAVQEVLTMERAFRR
jgi:malonyl CoA-acyl carrier protein transacylase